jgi:hypothetical protein
MTLDCPFAITSDPPPLIPFDNRSKPLQNRSKSLQNRVRPSPNCVKPLPNDAKPDHDAPQLPTIRKGNTASASKIEADVTRRSTAERSPSESSAMNRKRQIKNWVFAKCLTDRLQAAFSTLSECSSDAFAARPDGWHRTCRRGRIVGMTRRRLLAMIGIAGLLAGLAWWFWPDRLAAEERPFVGVWTFRQSGLLSTLTLTDDHRCIIHVVGIETPEGSGRWWVRDGKFFEDYEPNSVRRALRPLLERLGLRLNPAGSTDSSMFDFDGGNKVAHFSRANSN